MAASSGSGKGSHTPGASGRASRFATAEVAGHPAAPPRGACRPGWVRQLPTRATAVRKPPLAPPRAVKPSSTASRFANASASTEHLGEIRPAFQRNVRSSNRRSHPTSQLRPGPWHSPGQERLDSGPVPPATCGLRVTWHVTAARGSDRAGRWIRASHPKGSECLAPYRPGWSLPATATNTSCSDDRGSIGEYPGSGDLQEARR